MSVIQENTINNDLSGINHQATLAVNTPESVPIETEPEVTILEARDVPSTETPQKHISRKKWLERSKMKQFFNVSTLGTKKIASCVFCQKSYQEGESTGNLHKHIANNHYSQYREVERKENRRRTLDSLAKKTKSLPLSQTLVAEIKHNSGAFAAVSMITELILPFSTVESFSWNYLNGLIADTSLLKSRKTLVDKLDQYTRSFDEALFECLQKTTFVNVQLDIWSGGNGRSYLAVSVSFAPNTLEARALGNAGDGRILMNNMAEPKNCHLLDFTDFSQKRHTGTNLCAKVLEILNRFAITNKVASITVDNAANNIAFHSILIHDHLKVIGADCYTQLDGVRLIRCASHIINLQFQRVVEKLMEDEDINDAFQRISKVAERLKWSSQLRASIQEYDLPLIPLEPEVRWIYKWRQVDCFLRNRASYLEWFAKVGCDNESTATRKLKELLYFTPETIQTLQFFIDACQIFKSFTDMLQDDETSNLPDGLSVYYTLNHFYDMCHLASKGHKIPEPSDDSLDLSFLNGREGLLPERRNLVLDAILSARATFNQYFETAKSNILYYVAAVLDPSSKFDNFIFLMQEDESRMRLKEVDTFISSYLKKCPTKIGKSWQKAEAKLSSRPGRVSKSMKVNVRNLNLAAGVASNLNINEWELYKHDKMVIGGSRNEVIEWWYDHRLHYPNLFVLAMSLIYTKISTSGVERLFSISGKVLSKDRRSLHSDNTRRIMLMRNRFKSFGLFNRDLVFNASSDLDDSSHESSDDYMNNGGISA